MEIKKFFYLLSVTSFLNVNFFMTKLVLFFLFLILYNSLWVSGIYLNTVCENISIAFLCWWTFFSYTILSYNIECYYILLLVFVCVHAFLLNIFIDADMNQPWCRRSLVSKQLPAVTPFMVCPRYKAALPGVTPRIRISSSWRCTRLPLISIGNLFSKVCTPMP